MGRNCKLTGAVPSARFLDLCCHHLFVFHVKPKVNTDL